MHPEENNILATWHDNAPAWVRTIQQQEIKSRSLITDRAILEEILALAPASILDAGCGEGWLCRELAKHGISATGMDGVAALIEAAKQAGPGRYLALSYEDILQGNTSGLERYDAIVFNYSIFEKDGVLPLFLSLKKHLSENGHLLIQTISPNNDLFLQRPPNGWMTEHWNGLNDQYKSPFSWYYRSETEWLHLFEMAGFELVKKRENIHPETGGCFSVVYVLGIQSSRGFTAAPRPSPFE